METNQFVTTSEIEILREAHVKFNFISIKQTPTERVTLEHLVFAKNLKTREQIVVIDCEGGKRYRTLPLTVLKPLFFKNKEIGCTKEGVKYFNNRFYHENTKHLYCIVPDKIAKDQCGMNLETILENEEKIFAPSLSAAYDPNFLPIPFVEIEVLRINTLLTTPKTTVNNLNFARLIEEIEKKENQIPVPAKPRPPEKEFKCYNKCGEDPFLHRFYCRTVFKPQSEGEEIDFFNCYPKSNIGTYELINGFSMPPIIQRSLIKEELESKGGNAEASATEYSERSEAGKRIETILERNYRKCGSSTMFKNAHKIGFKLIFSNTFNIFSNIVPIQEQLKILNEKRIQKLKELDKESERLEQMEQLRNTHDQQKNINSLSSNTPNQISENTTKKFIIVEPQNSFNNSFELSQQKETKQTKKSTNNKQIEKKITKEDDENNDEEENDDDNNNDEKDSDKSSKSIIKEKHSNDTNRPGLHVKNDIPTSIPTNADFRLKPSLQTAQNFLPKKPEPVKETKKRKVSATSVRKKVNCSDKVTPTETKKKKINIDNSSDTTSTPSITKKSKTKSSTTNDNSSSTNNSTTNKDSKKNSANSKKKRKKDQSSSSSSSDESSSDEKEASEDEESSAESSSEKEEESSDNEDEEESSSSSTESTKSSAKSKKRKLKSKQTLKNSSKKIKSEEKNNNSSSKVVTTPLENVKKLQSILKSSSTSVGSKNVLVSFKKPETKNEKILSLYKTVVESYHGDSEIDYDFLLNNFHDLESIEENQKLKTIFQKIIIPFYSIMKREENTEAFTMIRRRNDLNLVNDLASAID